MIDYFALLGEPRRPWLEPEGLKQKFLALSAAAHPDRTHGAGLAERAAAQSRYTELNAAYQCLREPRARLGHLLELEQGFPCREIQRIPPALMDLSMDIGAACREADLLAAHNANTTSPLLKVELFGRGQQLTGTLRALQKKIAALSQGILQEIKQIDSQWAAPPPARDSLRRLQELYHLLGYVNRWTGQVQERLVRLIF